MEGIIEKTYKDVNGRDVCKLCGLFVEHPTKVSLCECTDEDFEQEEWGWKFQ